MAASRGEISPATVFRQSAFATSTSSRSGAHELVAYRDYVSGEPLGYWRSTSGFEVDFILGDHTAVEVKAKESVAAQDVKSLRALAEERKLKRYLCVSLEPRRRQADGITFLPVGAFLEALWGGEYA